MKTRKQKCEYGASAGFTLVELMIAMVLGLVVIAGIVSTLMANRQNYRTNEGLSQVQESTRTAFELLARDIRQSGANGCDNTGRVSNLLDPAAGLWWQDWFVMNGFEGDEADPAVATGTAVAERVAGTDSIHLQSIGGNGYSIESHDALAATLTINAAATDLVAGDVLVVCDFDHAAIVQATGYNATDVEVTHGVGSGSPGNCSTGIGFPSVCTMPGNVYTFGPNSQVARLVVTDWYVGNNGRADEGGRSLYRRRLGAGATLVAEEVVSGVRDMQLRYRLNGNDALVDADAVGAWGDVNAVAITLTVESADQRVTTAPDVNDGRLQRTVTTLVTLRNRVP